MKLITDIESDGLYETAKQIWCASCFDLEKLEWHLFIHDNHISEITSEVRKRIAQWIKSSSIFIYPMSSLPKLLNEAKRIIGHNIIRFDIPLVNKLLGTGLSWEKCTDTFILSSIFSPDRLGGHSLRAWGERLQIPKGEFSGFSNFSLEMLRYNIQDVVVTRKLYEHLLKEKDNKHEAGKGVKWNAALTMEHEISSIIFESEVRGFPVDREWMEKVLSKIEGEIAQIDAELDKLLPYLVVWHTETMEQGAYNEFLFRGVTRSGVEEWINGFKSVHSKKHNMLPKPTLKWCKANGAHSETVKKWYGDDFVNVSGPFTKVTFEKVDINSQNQLKAYLLTQGWEPLQFTEKGSPQICEQSLERVAKKTPTLGKLSLRGKLTHRRNVIKGKKEGKGLLCMIREDGRISPRNNTVGAVTGRSTHSGLVNLPNVDTLYGPHFRKMFTSGNSPEYPMWSFKTELRDKDGNYALDSKGQKKIITVETCKPALIGCDASGIELRLLAHFLDDDEFTKEVISGDIHSRFWGVNVKWIGSRSASKGVTYAFLYGGGKDKLGSMADNGRDSVGLSEILSYGWKQVGEDMFILPWMEKRGESPVNFLVAQNTIIGAEITSNYLNGIPELGELVTKLKDFAKANKYLVGIDGRKLTCRAPHAALNLKIQNTGNVVYKRSIIIAKEMFKKARVPYDLVTFMHDEQQLITDPKHREFAKEALDRSLREAGQYYNLKCPLEGQSKCGISWLNTH